MTKLLFTASDRVSAARCHYLPLLWGFWARWERCDLLRGLAGSCSGLCRQGCWVARSVVVVEVNGYEIEPGANLSRANTVGSEAAK